MYTERNIYLCSLVQGSSQWRRGNGPGGTGGGAGGGFQVYEYAKVYLPTTLGCCCTQKRRMDVEEERRTRRQFEPGRLEGGVPHKSQALVSPS